MTVAMRVICRSSESGVLERVDALNEAHHTVSGYLVRISSNVESESWLAMSIKSVLKSEDSVLRQQIHQAWVIAESRILDEKGKQGSGKQEPE